MSPNPLHSSLGDELRASRQAQGLSMADMSAQTRVHVRYLTALEEGSWSALPSRVFALGYVRAYAMALGLDEQRAIEQFKRESPDGSVPLQAPIGVAFQDIRRHSPRVFAGVAVVIAAVIGWNVFQRISRIQAPVASNIAAVPDSWAKTDDADQAAPVTIGAPRPAAPDQSVPALYVTPGLELQMTGVDPTNLEAVAAANAASAPPVQAAFNPRGAIYGESADASQVVLQVRKPAALVVRMADNRVLFARQLAAGEAWRAPLGVAATVDVSDPGVFDLYLNGEYGGRLTDVLTPLSSLNARAAANARQAALQSAAPLARPAPPASPTVGPIPATPVPPN